MPSLLVRDVKTETLARLKARASLHGRSLQGEVLAILEMEARLSDEAAWLVWLDDFRSRLAGRPESDSTELLRESRDER